MRTLVSALAVLTLVASVSVAALRYGTASGERGAVVIVEPRAHANFRAVLDNFLKVVPAEYDTLYVYHGTENKQAAQAATAGWVAAGKRVVLASVGVPNLTADGYNALLKSRGFWEGIDAEKILVVQTDAAACEMSPHSLRQFEKFGYIGCSYGQGIPTGRDSRAWGKHAYFGVGGLSFRRKSFCLRCCERAGGAGDDGTTPEDVFFSDCVADFGEPKPSPMDLAQFCTQNKFDQKSWGAHQIGKQLNAAQKKAFYAYCPAAVIT